MLPLRSQNEVTKNRKYVQCKLYNVQGLCLVTIWLSSPACSWPCRTSITSITSLTISLSASSSALKYSVYHTVCPPNSSSLARWSTCFYGCSSFCSFFRYIHGIKTYVSGSTGLKCVLNHVFKLYIDPHGSKLSPDSWVFNVSV